MFFSDFIYMMECINNINYNSSRIYIIMESDGDYKEDNIIISSSKISSIRRFYESTNEFNRAKITNLINNNIGNIDKVHNIVMEYIKLKNIERNYNDER